MTWFGAHKFCSARGMQLATMINKNEQNSLIAHLNSLSRFQGIFPNWFSKLNWIQNTCMILQKTLACGSMECLWVENLVIAPAFGSTRWKVLLGQNQPRQTPLSLVLLQKSKPTKYLIIKMNLLVFGIAFDLKSFKLCTH